MEVNVYNAVQLKIYTLIMTYPFQRAALACPPKMYAYYA